jgi:hypothetical protein
MATYYTFESDFLSNWDVNAGPKLAIEISFSLGESISPESLPKLVFEVDWPPGEQPSHFLDYDIPLASQRLIETLKNVGVDNIETFPALLNNTVTGESWRGYFALNVLGALDVANMKESKYHNPFEKECEGLGVTFVEFDELVLDKAKVGKCKELMFRVKEDGQLIAHERVIDYLSAHVPDGGWGIDVTEVSVK